VNHDRALHVLLGLILVCLVLLVAQGFGLGVRAGEDQGSYRVNLIKAKPTWLMRVDTVTGRVEKLEIPDGERWVTLGEPEPDLAGIGGEGLDQPPPLAEAPPEPARRMAVPRPPQPAPTPAPAQTEVTALVAALGPDNPREIRTWAAGLLGSYVAEAPETSRPALIEALGDPDASVVVAAARALGRSRDPESLAALESLASHPDAKVRAAAREAIASHE
jgi:hypothetical protein